MMIKLQKKALRAGMLALSVFSFCMFFAACGKQEAPATEPAIVIETQAQTQVQTQPATQPVTEAPTTQATLPSAYLEYNGETYAPKEGLETILLMGLDKHEMETEAIGYTNKMQSDFLLVLVVNEAAGTCDVLHLNRDTMCEVPRLGIGGFNTGTYEAQLCLAHTYGSGGSDSSINAMKAVSMLLGGVNIDHYMTLTMDGVALVNDMVGGVTVTVPQDLTPVDPELELGKEVTLKGDQALLFVRARMSLEDGSNLSRMERQRTYLTAFYEKLMGSVSKDPDFAAKIVYKLGDMFTTDYSTNGLERIFAVLANSTISPFYTIEGEAVRGRFMEFYPDETSLQETVLELFYDKVS